MAHVVFLTWSGGGNQTPEIGGAQALVAAGHQVTFVGYDNQRERLEGLGFGFSVLDLASARLSERRLKMEAMAALSEGVFACEEHLEEVPIALGALACDLVVVDCLMFAALAAVQDMEMPSVVLVHSAPGALVPPRGSVEEVVLAPLNDLRLRQGLEEVSQLWDAWAPSVTLCASLEELDPLAGRVPSSFEYLGPIFEQGESIPWESPWPIDDPRPLVLVSFSTGKAWDQRSRIEKTLNALADRPYRVLVASGAADMGGLAIPSNTAVWERVHHGALMADVDLVISHGGHGTLCASLVEGVPMVLMPNPGADQFALAAQAHAMGVAEVFDEGGTAADLGGVVDRIFADRAYRERALAVSLKINPGVPAQSFVRRIESLI